jgi:TatD DNase family protein
MKEKKETQEKFFKAQIKLAKKYSLPIIIHTRNSKEETLETLKEMEAKKFVLHCFSEDLDYAYKALYYSDECMISFS